MNSHGGSSQRRGAPDGDGNGDAGIKLEQEVEVKLEPGEPPECVVCLARAADGRAVRGARTARAGTPLPAFLSRYSPALAVPGSLDELAVCGACLHLADVLEQAEREYLRLRDSFEALLSRNPLFAPRAAAAARRVKSELAPHGHDDDSEDEPLARAKAKRSAKGLKKKKKATSTGKKRKGSISDKYRYRRDALSEIVCCYSKSHLF